MLVIDIEDLDDADSSNATNTVQRLQDEVKEKDATIEQLQLQISELQKHFLNWIDISDKNTSDSEEKLDELSKTHVAEIPIDEDQSYFASYAHFHIHHEMLSVSKFINIAKFCAPNWSLELPIHSNFFVPVGHGSYGELSGCHFDESTVIRAKNCNGPWMWNVNFINVLITSRCEASDRS